MIPVFYYVGAIPKLYNYTSADDVQIAIRTYISNLGGVAMVISTHIGFSATLYVIL
jgi:hypothetical protein